MEKSGKIENTGDYNIYKMGNPATTKEGEDWWYSLATHDRKCLYFLCINCYSKQTQCTHARRQNRKMHDIKQGRSQLKPSLLQKLKK